MAIAEKSTYLKDVIEDLRKQWPDNETVNIVCHGHSVPAGYFATPAVMTFDAYPHLLHVGLKDVFPDAVINVIVTAIGGENSLAGEKRMDDIMAHRPRVLTIDYALNDRGLDILAAEKSWRSMIERGLREHAKIILLTPTADNSYLNESTRPQWELLQNHAQQVRDLAAEYGIGLVDSLKSFEEYEQSGHPMTDLLSWINHPNRRGHELVANEMLSWFNKL